jgi:intracellular multiplication protein IcmO
VPKHIERQHEVKNDQRIADVRPWGEKMQEKLSDPGNFLFFGGPLVILALIMPVVLPISILLFLAGHFAVMRMKFLLPYRYPAHRGTNPETKKPGDGILLIGSVRAESPYEKFKQCWLSDSDLRKHWLIMGSTGSGKSETLKGIFYNALCWGSGFFCADGKADNKLPTDGYTMVKAFGRSDDMLALNFLLGGKTPQQVARSRRRRSNGLNPFSTGDADTLIQMGANLLPKAEGDGKSWQEKALAVWRAVITALCYKRDTQGFTLSVGVIIDYLSLTKIEELYVEGHKEAAASGTQSWSYGYVGIKNYLDSGLPAYSVEKLQKKHNLVDAGVPLPPHSMSGQGSKGKAAPGRETEQDPAALEQHGYRVGQLMPVLNLLDKTYGYIFRAPFSEIDMIDVALHNRILFLLIPSLEKSSQEAENLGKLSIACLRVMMARNLGSELEGSREELIESKATQAPYPYIVALDELGYYFADGIAVMFAQARSLGMSMIAAAQDLEKLTEGSRAAEAGAMMGNTVNKIFMKIDDPDKTWKLVSATVGKVQVASYGTYEAGRGAGGYKRDTRLSVGEQEMVTYGEMQKYTEGQAVMNALGVSSRISTFYMGDWLERLRNQSFHLNRFLQVHEPSEEEVEAYSVEVPTAKSTQKLENGQALMDVLTGRRTTAPAPQQPAFAELSRVAAILNAEMSGIDPVERGIVFYMSLRNLIASGATQSVSKDAHSAAAEILGSPEAQGLAQSLDEYGLPDPLSLLRKPVSEILRPVDEMPLRTPAVAHSTGAFSMSPEPIIPDTSVPGLSAPASSIGDFGFGYGQSQPADPVQQLIEDGRPGMQPGQPAAWVSQAVADANHMIERPRSANNSAIGLSEPTMEELAALEKELGSPTPKASAHTMQKVVSAHITPNTMGTGAVSVAEMESFFNDVVLGPNDETATK